MELGSQDDVSIPRTKCGKCKQGLKRNIYTISILLGAIIGIVFGISLIYFKVNDATVELIKLPGDLFMRAIYMLVAPLVVTSIICGITMSKTSTLKSIGVFLPIYCISTTFMAGLTGVALHFMTPSFGKSIVNETGSYNNFHSVQDTVLDVFRNIVPDNLLRAFIQVSETEYLEGANQTMKPEDKYIVYKNSSNMCGLIFFSIFFGVVLARLDEKAKLVSSFVHSLNQVIMEMVRLIMLICPLAIIFLIAGSMAQGKDNLNAFSGAIAVAGLHVAGLFFHCFVTLNLTYYLFTRKNPLRFMLGMKDAFLTAWATLSSALTLPTTIRCMEENNKMKTSLTRLVLPITATINMDGGSMIGTQAALFTARVMGIPITTDKLIIILLMSSIGSMGAAAVPGTLLVILATTLTPVNLPHDFVAIFVTLELIVDRFRTCSNIYGDCVGVAVIDRMQRRERNR